MTTSAHRRVSQVWETVTVDPAASIRRGSGNPPVLSGHPSPLP
jgi:hypothetical protein